MRITDATGADFELLTAIWERAVRATHHFLSEEDIIRYRGLIRDTYLAQVELYLAVEDDAVIGFMGMTPPEGKPGTGEAVPAKVVMLFVDPEHHGRGAGRSLLRHAEEKYGSLEVDVNEDNSGARIFYEKCGFAVFGRSATDEQGDPFPLLHLRRLAAL